MSNPYKQEQVRILCDLFWKFHNDRLNDPTINDMTPYVKPILKQINRGKIEELKQLLDITSRGDGLPSGTYETDLILGQVVKDRIATLKSKGEDRNE